MKRRHLLLLQKLNHLLKLSQIPIWWNKWYKWVMELIWLKRLLKLSKISQFLQLLIWYRVWFLKKKRKKLKKEVLGVVLFVLSWIKLIWILAKCVENFTSLLMKLKKKDKGNKKLLRNKRRKERKSKRKKRRNKLSLRKKERLKRKLRDRKRLKKRKKFLENLSLLQQKWFSEENLHLIHFSLFKSSTIQIKR